MEMLKRGGEINGNKNQTDSDPLIRLDQTHIIPIKDAAAHPQRRTEGRWSSMGTTECFPISSCSSSLPPCPSEGEREVPRPGRRRALITEAQRGPMAVAPAVGHLGASLTPRISKNKKIRKGKWGCN